MKGFLALALFGLSWAASAVSSLGESKCAETVGSFDYESFDDELVGVEVPEEEEPVAVAQNTKPMAMIDPLDLGDEFAIIPLRFSANGAPWIALRGSENGFTFEMHPTNEYGLVDEHLSDILPSTRTEGRYRMQFLYGWCRVFVVDDVALPADANERFADGELTWFDMSTANVPLGVQKPTWDFLKGLGIEPDDFFNKVPFSILESRADIPVSIGTFEPQSLPNLGATCFINSSVQMLFFLEPLTREIFSAVSALPQPLTNTALVFLGMLESQMLLGQRVTAGFMDSWVSYIRRFYPQIRSYVQHDAAEFIQQYLPLLQKELQGAHQWKPTFLDRLVKVNREIIRECDQWMEHRRLPIERQSDYFWDLQPTVADGANAYDLHYLLRKSLDWSLFEGIHDHQGCNLRHQARLRDLPPILMIKLSRLDWGPGIPEGRKIARNINFPLRSLDLTDYVEREGGLEGERFVYDLVATINHNGSHRGGHYTTTIFRSDTEALLLSDTIIVQDATVGSLLDFSRKAAVLITYVRRPQAESQNVQPFDETTLPLVEGQKAFDYSQLYQWVNKRQPASTIKASESKGKEPAVDGLFGLEDLVLVPEKTPNTTSASETPLAEGVTAAAQQEDEVDPDMALALKLSMETSSSSSCTPLVASVINEADEDDFSFVLRISTMSEAAQAIAKERRDAAIAAKRRQSANTAWYLGNGSHLSYSVFDAIDRYNDSPTPVYAGWKRNGSERDLGARQPPAANDDRAKRARTEAASDNSLQNAALDELLFPEEDFEQLPLMNDPGLRSGECTDFGTRPNLPHFDSDDGPFI